MTTAWISMPPPSTTPMVPLLVAAGRASVTLVEAAGQTPVLQTAVVTVFFKPMSESHATPASTYGRTILLGNLYLATSGNSQLPDDPMLVTALVADPSTLV